MSKVYIYRGKNDTATIYYNKEYPEEHGVPVFAYEGKIPEGAGVLKTDGRKLYWEEIPVDDVPMVEPDAPVPEEEKEATAEELIDIFLGVKKGE